VFPAVCDMGVYENVVDPANTLSEAEQKRGEEEETSSKEDEMHQARVKKAQWDKPKGRGV